MAIDIVRQKGSVNGGIASAEAALAANPARTSWFIQNLGQNPLFVKEGASAAVDDFTVILGAAGANDNGTGGAYESPAGQVYVGAISIKGTSPRYVISERTVA